MWFCEMLGLSLWSYLDMLRGSCCFYSLVTHRVLSGRWSGCTDLTSLAPTHPP
jgi:hypothetical protein